MPSPCRADFAQARKMPGLAWGIPAAYCITGSLLRQVAGTACSKCYARRGNYVPHGVQAAYHRRLDEYTQLGPSSWAATMTDRLRTVQQRTAIPRYIRWFDSGDLQSVDMLAAIVNVAEHTKRWRHWVSTRERGTVLALARDQIQIPRNATIRVSAPMIDATTSPPEVPGVTAATIHSHRASSALDGAYRCAALDRGGQCGRCRRCWDRNVPIVAYPLH